MIQFRTAAKFTFFFEDFSKYFLNGRSTSVLAASGLYSRLTRVNRGEVGGGGREGGKRLLVGWLRLIGLVAGVPQNCYSTSHPPTVIRILQLLSF